MKSPSPPEPLIGYVLKQYPRLSETFILNEILGLESKGVPVTVFSLRHATEGRFHPALADVQSPVTYLPDLDKRAFLESLRALPCLRIENLPDVFDFVDQLPAPRRARLMLDAINVAHQAQTAGVTHLHAHFMTVAAHATHIAHLLTGIPYTVTAHAKDVYRHTIDWTVAARIGGHATAVITVCDANLAYLKQKLDGSGTNIVRIYNGLGPQDPPVQRSKRTPGLILGVGRLVEKKGFDLLLDAVAKLVPQRPEISCLLIGDGDQSAALEDQAASLGIQKHVTFAGPKSQHEVARWLRKAHILAAPCRIGSDGNQDALPTILLESLGSGLPAVTTPVAGIPEIIEDSKQGLIVPPDDPSALANGLETLLDDPQMWDEMADAGPTKLAAHFDRDATIVELINTVTTGRTSS